MLFLSVTNTQPTFSSSLTFIYPKAAKINCLYTFSALH